MLPIRFLDANSRRLQANTASALSAIALCNRINQDLIASKGGAVNGLVELVNSKNPVCQVKAACAIESLAQGNSNVQRLIEDAGAVRPLIRLLKIWSIEVKEQGTVTRNDKLCQLSTVVYRLFTNLACYFTALLHLPSDMTVEKEMAPSLFFLIDERLFMHM